MLISAFRATLEEVRAADVIVHVRDIAHADSRGAEPRTSRRSSTELGVADRADRADRGVEQARPARSPTPRRDRSSGEARPTAPLAVSALTGRGDRPAARGDRGPARARPSLIELDLDSRRRPRPALALRARRGDEPLRRRRRPAPDRPRRPRPGRAGEAAVCGGGGGARRRACRLTLPFEARLRRTGSRKRHDYPL